MAIQSQNGKAFEYACLMAIYNFLHNDQPVIIQKDNAFNTAQNDFNLQPSFEQNRMIKAANAGIISLAMMEPRLENPLDNTPLTLSLQIDAVARKDKKNKGDVRDIVCARKENKWEIGISCKHNHDAVKHSRLSSKIDFGESWMDMPCSPIYWDTVVPIFNRLQELRSHSSATMRWTELNTVNLNKEEDIYVPVLKAFMSEMKRICAINMNGSQPAARLLQYLLGGKDFYKLIERDANETTDIQVFNLKGTLGESANSIKPRIKVKPPQMPINLLKIDFKLDKTGARSKTTVIANFDKGWSISFRIHNASSKIEPSLKFDIKLEGIPTTLQQHTNIW